MSHSDPLVVIDVTTYSHGGRRHWRVECRETAPCLMVPEIYGLSAAVNEALARLEAIHQAAHALRDDA